MRAATAGRVLLLYSALRQVSIALGVSIGGHAQAVRPLYRPGARIAVQRHRQAGDRLVLLTSSSNYVGEAVCEDLGLDACVCNRFEVDAEGRQECQQQEQRQSQHHRPRDNAVERHHTEQNDEGKGEKGKEAYLGGLL